MQLHLIIIYVAIIAFQIDTSIGVAQNRKDVLTCIQKKTISVEIFPGFADQFRCQARPVKLTKRDDYTYTKGIGSHKLHTIGKNWSDARKICIAEGGHLAIVNSKAEAQALQRIYKKQNHEIRNAIFDKLAWLGLHDQFEEGDWITVLGDSLSSTGYERWDIKNCNKEVQPDNLGGNQNCGALFRDCGTMDDYQCNRKLAFFCEIPDVCTD